MIKLVPWNKCPLENGDVPVAIISLPDAIDRRATLIERGLTSGLVNEYWPAFDMRGLHDSELHSYSQYHDIIKLYGRPPISAELGCLFSHAAIIKWLSEQDKVSQVVVFEDDVVPETFCNLDTLRKLAEILTEPATSGKPFICHLGPRAEQWRTAFTRKISKDGADIPGLDLFDYVDKKANLWRAHAYIFSKGAAERYVKVSRDSGFLADDWRFITDQTFSRMILVNPPLFTQDEDVVSTIDPRNKRVSVFGEIAVRNDVGFLCYPNFNRIVKGGWFVKHFVRWGLVNFYRILPGKILY